MYKAPRGTADILPEAQAYWTFVESKAVALCHLYGYQRLDTPTFEDAALFSRSIGAETDIVSKEMYLFQDRGGNDLTLRPEGTAPICRAYLEHGLHNLPQPVKLYYLANIFRYERPQAGRYREHHQFGFEAIGDGDPLLDAEVIDLALRFYASLGISQLNLKLNSIGCRECRPGYVKSLKDYYAGYGTTLCADCQTRLEKNPLRLLDCKQPACQAAAETAPQSRDYLCSECRSHLEKLLEYLSALEIGYQFDHRLVRGLDYYTKTVFEVQPQGEEGAQIALGGGGRYDNLIAELGGRATPAVGFAAGLERIIRSLAKQQAPVPPLPQAGIFIAHMGEAAKTEAIRVSASLRRAGLAVITASGQRSLKAQLRQADALGSRYTLILGEEEVKNQVATLRNMAAAEQTMIPLAELTSKLTEIAA